MCACFQVLSKQLTVWNAYLSPLGLQLVIALLFSFDLPRTGIESTASSLASAAAAAVPFLLSLAMYMFCHSWWFGDQTVLVAKYTQNGASNGGIAYNRRI